MDSNAPLEVLDQIAQTLATRLDINNVAQSSRRLYLRFNFQLYKQYGDDALGWAVEKGNERTIEMALNHPRSTQAKRAALYVAIINRNEAIFKNLLANMSVYDLKTDRMNVGTFLTCALNHKSSRNILMRLLRMDFLFFSAHASNLCLVLELDDADFCEAKTQFLTSWLKNGYPLNQPRQHNTHEDIPLLVALRNKDHEALRLLLGAGAATQAKDYFGLPPLNKADERLISAIESRNYTGVVAALENHANVDTLIDSECCCTSNTVTCFTVAGDEVCRKGAFNALHLAVVHSDEEIAVRLVEALADLRTCYPVATDVSIMQSTSGPTALHDAAKLNKLKVMEYICTLPHAADLLNWCDADGSTPLTVASRYCNLAMMQLLIKNGAFVDHEDKENLPTLARVGEDCKTFGASIREAAKLLISSGATWRARDGKSFFTHILMQRNLSLAEAFVHSGGGISSLEVFRIMRLLWRNSDDCERSRLWLWSISRLGMAAKDELALNKVLRASTAELEAVANEPGLEGRVWNRFKGQSRAVFVVQLVEEFYVHSPT
ncbi:hypothetical protein K4F52_004130 [Lecanicillium sp. MT-2017a]|nr:hypothetical protein K4F52_004130 [Lecanicillium sp. MT-2017a]